MANTRAAVAEVIDLERFRAKVAADQGFRTWLARFQEQFGPETRLEDLSPSTLLYLASPGEENLYVFFDLVMGARGLGGSVRFRLDGLEYGVKLFPFGGYVRLIGMYPPAKDAGPDAVETAGPVTRLASMARRSVCSAMGDEP